MAIDRFRVGEAAMEVMDYLAEGYPEGEIEAVVVCAAVRATPGGERRVRWVAEPTDRELVIGTLHSALLSAQNPSSE